MSYRSKKIEVYDSKAGYDIIAEEYDKYSDYLDDFDSYKFWRLIPDIKNKKILDIGCGTGRITLDLVKKGAQVTALDVSPNMLNILKKKLNISKYQVNLVNADAINMPFDYEEFDGATMSLGLLHFENIEKVIKEISRVLKEGAFLVITHNIQKKDPVLKVGKISLKIKSYFAKLENILDALESNLLRVDIVDEVIEKGAIISYIIKATKC